MKRQGMLRSLAKSVLHNAGVLVVALAVAWLGTRVDALLGLPALSFPVEWLVGLILLGLGLLLRLWAAYSFYAHQMRVIVLRPQSTLITDGPYRFSRNPLYLGGNVFMFLGAALLLRSPAAVALTVLHLPLVDRFIRREERQLEEMFGDDWRRYQARVRRWV